MLTQRVIACLDVKDGRVVKGTGFVNLRDGSNGQMSVRWGKIGRKGRSSSGLN